ncbi:MAG: energy-coupling factor ABC transporter permease [Gammaproteobacteria bacterium]|nr:energy-coupling factor ABC transporter permease [Gammaproteobacteria bacterium]
MDLNSIHLGSLWIWAHLIYWPIIIWAVWRAPWSIILQKDSSNTLFATCMVLFLLWHLRVQVEQGLVIHLLGATLLTLMFRWQVALLANALILLGITLTSAADFAAFALNALVTGVLPIFISHLIWRFNEWYLPANFFLYVFVAGFFAGGLSILVSGFVSYQLLSLVDNQLSIEILDEYLMIFIPIMYPEAFLTGAAISIFVLYKPQWISTFDDQRYLSDQ